MSPDGRQLRLQGAHLSSMHSRCVEAQGLRNRQAGNCALSCTGKKASQWLTGATPGLALPGLVNTLESPAEAGNGWQQDLPDTSCTRPSRTSPCQLRAATGD